MGFFDRLAFGWRLGMTSLGVVARDKTLMLFPILSGLSGLALAGAFVFGIGPENFQVQVQHAQDSGEVPPVLIAAAFAAYVLLSFVAVYFNVALIGAAQLSIGGKDTTVGDGLRVANQHLGNIFGWALLSGTVGLLLNMIESNGRVGQVIRSLLGAAWAVITYFVVPVMIFEQRSPTAAIGRSIDLMKKSWGENAGAQVGIGLLVALACILIAAVGLTLSFVVLPSAVVLVPLTFVAIALVALLGMTAKAVLAVGLYQYATGTGGTGVFKSEDLRAAFR